MKTLLLAAAPVIAKAVGVKPAFIEIIIVVGVAMAVWLWANS